MAEQNDPLVKLEELFNNQNDNVVALAEAISDLKDTIGELKVTITKQTTATKENTESTIKQSAATENQTKAFNNANINETKNAQSFANSAAENLKNGGYNGSNQGPYAKATDTNDYTKANRDATVEVAVGTNNIIENMNKSVKQAEEEQRKQQYNYEQLNSDKFRKMFSRYGGVLNEVYENPELYKWQYHQANEISTGHANTRHFDYLISTFIEKGGLNIIQATKEANRIIGTDMLYNQLGIKVGSRAEPGSLLSGWMGNTLATVAGTAPGFLKTISSITSFLSNPIVNSLKLIWSTAVEQMVKIFAEGFKEFYGLKAMKDRMAAASQLGLLTGSLGTGLSLGDISTRDLNVSHGYMRMMGFQGSSSEWATKVGEAINAGITGGNGLISQSAAANLWMAQKAYGINMDTNAYANMFRAQGGSADLIHVIEALKVANMVNATNGVTAGLSNLNTLFQSMQSNILRVNDNYDNLIARMGTFAKLLSSSSISMRELQGLVDSAQQSNLQQRLLTAYYTTGGDLAAGSEQQIALSRSNPLALIQMRARGFLNMAAQSGTTGSPVADLIQREYLLDKFGFESLKNLPDFTKVLRDIAEGKETTQTARAIDLLQNEKEILNNQLRGIDALVNTTKHIQAWLFTDKGSEDFTDNLKKLYVNLGDDLGRALGVYDPDRVDETSRESVLKFLGAIANDTKTLANGSKNQQNNSGSESFYYVEGS